MQGAGFYLQSKEVVMNSEEQTLIDGLFTRLQQAEAGSAPRDALAQAGIGAGDQRDLVLMGNHGCMPCEGKAAAGH